MIMKHKIGEIFEYNGEWYQCVFGDDCKNCAFIKVSCSDDYSIGYCAADKREDNKDVIFKKLEKVGEPYVHYGKLYQCYKLLMETEIRLLPDNCYPVGKDNLVEIEIKQNKDMEEKKSNLKPFDIQKAREGKPVCTKNGRKARIICFDRKDKRPIIALIELCNGDHEWAYYYYANGLNLDNYPSVFDLMMLPEKERVMGECV